MKTKLFFILLAVFCLCLPSLSQADSPEIATVPVDQPVTVNGDTVEYLTEKNEVQAQGKVAVDYYGTVLRCDKLTVNTQTKDAVAEGHVRIEDPKGTMDGEKIIYNFDTKVGTVISASFSSPPYFGRAEKINRISDDHFSANNGYATTCDFDRPHFRIKSRKVDMYPGNKMQARGDSLYLAQSPVFYTPYLRQSFKDRNMIIQLSPGYSKKWGGYLLSAWRYNLTDELSGRVYLDYRSNLGVASGFGTNFSDTKIGKGDFKFYYTQERPRDIVQSEPAQFERYFARFRHKWEIDERSALINEYFKIVDSKRALRGIDNNMLKDYFPREYEQDSQPVSYSLLSHSFSQSNVNIMVQKRINRWYDAPQLEKLPEVNYNLPNFQVGELPLYFENTSNVASYALKHKVPAAENSDYRLNRADTFNKLSLPMKISFVDFTPFAATRQTYYDKDVNGGYIAPRTVFYTGTEASTKFYRIFDVRNDFLNLDLDGLRHIITPKISYSYNHDPSIYSDRLKQIDAVDAIGLNNSASFELSNKLQTKRDKQTVDLANFIASTTYTFYSADALTRARNSKSLSNYLFKLELFPYSWMVIHSDAEYNHKDDYFSNINYDLNLYCGQERSVALGQRYQKSGGNEMTLGSDWRLTPKWKLHLYQRYQIADVAELRRGMVKQEYGFSRDLHCWLFDLNYTIEKEYGRTVWCIFRLKAFPEASIDFSQNYGGSKAGSNNYY
jgi:lipopolysaccharide assembly outer membrane protein LptD (OstA)